MMTPLVEHNDIETHSKTKLVVSASAGTVNRAVGSRLSHHTTGNGRRQRINQRGFLGAIDESWEFAYRPDLMR
ncbi:hypothetical protein NXS19_000624 [Fusarium pseudograminearum]|nr:hypothetical protein NXS19_000624 [Fusarium pseudograminearum]